MENAWNLMKDQTNSRIKLLADKVISDLLLINCWVGRQDKIESLLKEIDDRTIEGPAAERVLNARSALWTMKNKPGISFKCGPYALDKVYTLKNNAKPPNEALLQVQSTSKGFSLTQLKNLAHSIGIDYQMAYRT